MVTFVIGYLAGNHVFVFPLILPRQLCIKLLRDVNCFNLLRERKVNYFDIYNIMSQVCKTKNLSNTIYLLNILYVSRLTRLCILFIKKIYNHYASREVTSYSPQHHQIYGMIRHEKLHIKDFAIANNKYLTYLLFVIKKNRSLYL